MTALTVTCVNPSAPTVLSHKVKRSTKLIPTYVLNAWAYDEPQCVQVCPVDCIPLDANNVESQDELMDKYKIITGQA